MANLDKIIESLETESSKNTPSSINNSEKPIGYKRRPWLDSDKSKGVNKPLNEKGSINPIHQPHSSTPFIDPYKKGSINPINKPLNEKGSMKGVDKPLNISLDRLRGVPLKIAQYIFEEAKLNDDKITKKITLSEIMQMLSLTKDSARTGLRFLLKSTLITREDFQIGKFGWSKYKLKEVFFDELNIAYNKGSIDPLSSFKISNEEKGSISSSNNFKNKTTTKYNIPDEWKNINVEPLSDIGFSETQLFQLYEKNLNIPNIVQESINHFAYALEYNPKCQEYKKDGKNPLNVLMGVLRKGGAWFEAEYISPKEKALKELVDFKKKEVERIKKLEEELLQYEFEKWFLSKSEDELNLLIADKREPGITENIWKLTRKGNLLNYFRQNVFNKIKSDKQE